MPDIFTALTSNQNSAYEELYREYLDERTLFLNNEINEDVIEDYVMYIIKWNKEDRDLPDDKRRPIKIFISSPGGNVFDANILIDVITNSKTPVWGIGLDLVASAAYIAFLACHRRCAFKNSVFLQHEGEMAIENSRSKFKQTSEFFDSQEKSTKEFILSRTNMTSDFYDSIFEVEFWMTSEKAKELGVVEEIIGIDCSMDDII